MTLMSWSWYCPLFNKEIGVQQCSGICSAVEIKACPWADLQGRTDDELARVLEEYGTPQKEQSG